MVNLSPKLLTATLLYALSLMKRWYFSLFISDEKKSEQGQFHQQVQVWPRDGPIWVGGGGCDSVRHHYQLCVCFLVIVL